MEVMSDGEQTCVGNDTTLADDVQLDLDILNSRDTE